MIRKMKITGYSDPGYNRLASTSPNPITVMINPKSYSRGMGASYTSQQAAGGTGTARAFNKDVGETFDLSLVFDGTGTVPDAPAKTVDVQIADLRRLCYEIVGEIHVPNYLVIAWGSLLFKGRLKTLAIDYTLFAPDGTALRATVKAGFIGYHDNKDSRRRQNRQSPDLTHAIVVHAGDTLPLLCDRIYGDSRFYAAVAAHNRLDDFRRLQAGTTLMFPPLSGSDA